MTRLGLDACTALARLTANLIDFVCPTCDAPFASQATAQIAPGHYETTLDCVNGHTLDITLTLTPRRP